jgi:hypothetical protein
VSGRRLLKTGAIPCADAKKRGNARARQAEDQPVTVELIIRWSLLRIQEGHF